mgnify:CR=1 FL=1
MNRNFAVKILLILAIVLQSFNAVSALLYAHQVDAQHLETVHDHASDTKSVIEDQVTDAGDDDHQSRHRTDHDGVDEGAEQRDHSLRHGLFRLRGGMRDGR